MPQVETHLNISGKRNRWVQIGSFIVMFCIMASLALVRDKSLFGYSFADENAGDKAEAVRMATENEVINTSEVGAKISGYGGPVPLEIYVSAGRIDSVKPLPNSETPGFFHRLYDEGLMSAWNGHTLEEAAVLQVDAASGATYSSNAVIGNVRAGVKDALGRKTERSGGFGVSASLIVALLVIIAGAVIPLIVHVKPGYKIVQDILNVAVLGFWAGVFIDYAMMLNFFAHGFTYTMAGLVTVVLLVVGFIYPLFNRPGYYCAWICPFGSLQELAGKISKRKIKLPHSTLQVLNSFRRVLWVVLLGFLITGIGYQWIDYEIFTAFLVKSASWAVIGIGLLFVILSIFLNRPFCRFVCPTGTLLRLRIPTK